MARRLKTLASLLLLSLTAFSQIDTNKKVCLVSIPCTTATKIAVDLVKGDSAIAELKSTKELLGLTQSMVSKQEAIIRAYLEKEELYNEQIKIFNQKETNYQQIVLGLEKDTKKLKRRVKILGYTVSVTGLSIGILLLTNN